MVAEFQGNLNENDKKLLDEALGELNKYRIVIKNKEGEPIDYVLPNAWYMVYNTR